VTGPAGVKQLEFSKEASPVSVLSGTVGYRTFKLHVLFKENIIQRQAKNEKYLINNLAAIVSLFEPLPSYVFLWDV
jgi:hypothetical protein